jgi:hypothetical protein
VHDSQKVNHNFTSIAQPTRTTPCATACPPE